MILGILPDCAVGVEAHAQDWESDLLPEEAALVAGAVERRRREFAAGRNCARHALERLGWFDFPILAGTEHEPLWPPGIAGSITHCPGYAAAAVTARSEVRSLGIDAERNVALPTGVVRLVCTSAEQREMFHVDCVSVPTLIFSAKESVYKAWYPMTGRRLSYLDVAIDLDLTHSAFSVCLLAPGTLTALTGQPALTGRFAMTPEHIFTAVTVPA